MEEHQGPSRRHSSTERLVAISLGLICVISPLFIDKKSYTIEELELEEQAFLSISTYLVLVLLVLIIVAVFSCYLDHSLTRFDPYWIYRVGGSSGGIIALLVVLTFILRNSIYEDQDDPAATLDQRIPPSDSSRSFWGSIGVPKEELCSRIS
ncbi:hypothetical protein R6Q59_023239 [Mikania micrantha]